MNPFRLPRWRFMNCCGRAWGHDAAPRLDGSDKSQVNGIAFLNDALFLIGCVAFPLFRRGFYRSRIIFLHGFFFIFSLLLIAKHFEPGTQNPYFGVPF